jgi:hypothetical protein
MAEECFRNFYNYTGSILAKARGTVVEADVLQLLICAKLEEFSSQPVRSLYW